MDKLEELAANYAKKIYKTIDERLMYQYKKEPWLRKIYLEIYQLTATLKDNVNAQVYRDAIADAELKFKDYISPEEYKEKLKGFIVKPSTGFGARLQFLFTGKL